VTVIPLSALEQGSVADWHELLANKIVLLGASISGIPDYVVSPVHGQVPGVVLHGMALDNLLTLGTGYLADRQSDARQIVSVVLVALFAYALPFMLWLLDHVRVRSILAATSLTIWTLLGVSCLAIGEPGLALAAIGFGICFDIIKPPVTAIYFYAILLAALVSVFQLNRGWPPGNWLGLLLLLLAFSHTVKPFYHESGRAQLPHRYSVLLMLYNRVLARRRG
jgi:CHASE2 domain